MFGKLKSRGMWEADSVKVLLEMEARWTLQCDGPGFPSLAGNRDRASGRELGLNYCLTSCGKTRSTCLEKHRLELKPLPSEPLYYIQCLTFWSKDLWLLSSWVALGFMSLSRSAPGICFLTRSGVSRYFHLYNTEPPLPLSIHLLNLFFWLFIY